jgi:ADP-ribosylglycohydrolase
MHGDGTFSPESATAQLGKGWLGHEALALAVLFALFARDFNEGIQISVNHSGNSAATGSITGNILGALCGLDSIDAHCWLELLELRRVIEHIAVDLVSWPSWDFESDEVWQRYPGH